jgi:hypothetical protein
MHKMSSQSSKNNSKVDLVQQHIDSYNKMFEKTYGAQREIGKFFEDLGLDPESAEQGVAVIEAIGTSFYMKGGRKAYAERLENMSTMISKPGASPYGLDRYTQGMKEMTFEQFIEALYTGVTDLALEQMSPEMQVVARYVFRSLLGTESGKSKLETSGNAYDVSNYMTFSNSHKISFTAPRENRSRGRSSRNSGDYIDRAAMDRAVDKAPRGDVPRGADTGRYA